MVQFHLVCQSQWATPDVANTLYEEHLKIYPLTKKDNPEPTELIDATGMEIDTVQMSLGML